MKLHRALLAAVLTACVASSSRDVAAQIDPGSLVMMYTRIRDGNPKPVQFGTILVIGAKDGGAYSANTEYWTVTPSMLPRDPDFVVEIIPVRGPEPGDSTSIAPEELGYVANADEVDLVSDADLDVLMDGEDHGDRASETATTTEIWQCWNCPVEAGRDTDGFKLVGVIFGYFPEDGDPIEHWLLSADYVYPSVRAPVRTQLRPTVAGEGTTPRTFLRGAASRFEAGRYIRVEAHTASASSLPVPPDTGGSEADTGGSEADTNGSEADIDGSEPESSRTWICSSTEGGASGSSSGWLFGAAGAVAALARGRGRRTHRKLRG